MPDQEINLRMKPFYLTEDQERWVHGTLGSMTAEEKAGQLFCYMAQPEKMAELKELVKRGMVGAVLFRPVLTEKELKTCFNDLDSIAEIPLLKAANLEEGGNGAFLGGTRFASQMEAAATGRKEDVARLARVCAKEAGRAGINWTFSPVADIDFNFRNPITNVRTYGSDAKKVLEFTEEYVKILQEAGIAACAKHFPGDGVDFRDQHLHPTCNTLSAREWYGTYGRIYQNLVDRGILSIMAAHILQPAVQREINPALRDGELLPGSLSRELLTGVLREQFGFNGLIITDASIMNGYSMAMEREKAIPSSIQNGCDMICFSPDIREDSEYILDGLRSGLLTEKRLEEAVVRILALKACVTKTCSAGLPALPAEAWAAECADRSVTLVKDVRGTLPVSTDRYDRIRLICFGDDRTPDGSLKEMMAAALQAEGFEVEAYDPMKDELNGTGKLNRRTLTVYISNMEAKSNHTAVHLYWSPNHALGTPRFPKELDYIFISFANPYHLADVPRVPVYINAYTAGKVTVKAVIDKICGRSEFKGISPVDPFCGLFDTRL